MKHLNILACIAILLGVAWLTAPATAAELNEASTLIDVQPRSDLAGSPPAFASAIDDLPLMDGLSPVADHDMLFVVPRQGRLAETVTEGTVDIDDVYRFYRHSLPQLGWTIVDGRTYDRGGERLRIDAHADGKVSTVRFSVHPQ